MAVRLVDLLTGPWQPENYQDTYTEDLKRIIDEKIAGKQPLPAGEPQPIPIELTDLIARLNASLERAKTKHPPG